MLEVRDLHVSYRKVRPVRGISILARPGEITLILGPNGAGKTTTLRAMAGLTRPDSGSMILDGADVTRLPADRLVRKGLSLIPEGRRIFAPLTVEENLLMGGYTISAAARRQNLRSIYDMFPVLEDRRLGAAGLLSGGEQQMLAFGRALMAQPRYVLMDEPSMGLAPALVESVLRAVRGMADSGLGVVMVEQNAEAALAVADQVMVVDRGTVVFSGSVAAARADRAILRTFLGEAALRDGGAPAGR